MQRARRDKQKKWHEFLAEKQREQKMKRHRAGKPVRNGSHKRLNKSELDIQVA
jgi:hypothetical protein